MKFFKSISIMFMIMALFIKPVLANEALTGKTHMQFIDQFLLPNLKTFSIQAGHLNVAAKKTCIMAGQDGFDDLKAQLKKTIHAWMPLQSSRYDAFEKNHHALRIYFWPNSRGAKQVLQLLKTQNMQKLKPKNFKNMSVAIQGLPIMEWLLYHGDSPLNSNDISLKTYSCDFLFAVSLNVKSLADKLVAEFSQSGENRKLLLNPNSNNPSYSQLSEVTLQFYKSIHAMVELVHGQKLSRPLAKELQYLRPKRLETWRSNQTKSNLLANITAISAAYDIFSPMVIASDNGAKIDQQIKQQFQITIKMIHQLPNNLYKALTAADRQTTWQQTQKLIKQLSILQQILATKAIAALNIPLGFNALDGD